MTYRQLEDLEAPIRRKLQSLCNTRQQPSWATLNYYLAAKYPKIHSQINLVDQDGNETVGKHPFERWLQEPEDIDGQNGATKSVEQLLKLATGAAISLSPSDRPPPS